MFVRFQAQPFTPLDVTPRTQPLPMSNPQPPHPSHPPTPNNANHNRCPPNANPPTPPPSRADLEERCKFLLAADDIAESEGIEVEAKG